MNDDDDLYGDLSTETTSDYIKKLEDKMQDYNEKIYELKKKVKKLEGFISACQKDKDNLSKENEVLKRNISALFNTAKTEIQRKDKLINELHAQYEDLHFRRTKTDLPNSKPIEEPPESFPQHRYKSSRDAERIEEPPESYPQHRYKSSRDAGRIEEPPESYPQHRYKSSRDVEYNSFNRNSRHGRSRQAYDNRDTDVRRDKIKSRSSNEKRTSPEKTDGSRRRPVSPQCRPRSPNQVPRQAPDKCDRIIAYRNKTGSRSSNERITSAEKTDGSRRRPRSPNQESRQASENYDRIIAYREKTRSSFSDETKTSAEKTDASRHRPVSPQYRPGSPNQESRQASENYDRIIARRDKTESRFSIEKITSAEKTDGTCHLPVSLQYRRISPNQKFRQASDNHDKIVAHRDKTELRLSNEKRASAAEQTDETRHRPVSPQYRRISPNQKFKQASDNHDKIVAQRDKTELRLSNEKRASTAEQTDGPRRRSVPVHLNNEPEFPATPCGVDQKVENGNDAVKKDMNPRASPKSESVIQKMVREAKRNSRLNSMRISKNIEPELSAELIQNATPLLQNVENAIQYIKEHEFPNPPQSAVQSESTAVEKGNRDYKLISIKLDKNAAPKLLTAAGGTVKNYRPLLQDSESAVVNKDPKPKLIKIAPVNSTMRNLKPPFKERTIQHQEMEIRDSESESEKIQSLFQDSESAVKSSTAAEQTLPQSNSQLLASDDQTVIKYPHYTPLKFVNGELVNFPFRLPKPMSPIANTPDYLKEKFNSETNKISPVVPMINENRILDKPVVPMKEQNEHSPAKIDHVDPVGSNNESSAAIIENHVNHVVSVKNTTPYKNCGVMEITSSCVMNSEAAENSTATRPVLSFTHDFEQGEFSRKGRKRPQIAIRYSVPKVARVDCS